MKRFFALFLIMLIAVSCTVNKKTNQKILKLPPVVVKNFSKSTTETTNLNNKINANQEKNSISDYPPPAYVMSQYLKAQYMLRNGKIKEAYLFLKESYSYYPAKKLLFQLIMISDYLKLWDNSIKYGEEYINNYEKSDVVIEILAKSYLTVGNYPNAEKFYLYLYNKNHYSTYIQKLTVISLKEKNIKNTEKYLQILKNSDKFNYYYYTARLNILKKQFPKALNNYKKALALNSDSFPVVRETAILYVKSGKIKEGIALLEESLTIHPDWLSLKLLLAKLYALEKNPSNMRKELTELKKQLNIAPWQLDYSIAYSLFQDNQIEKSIEQFDILHKKYPSNSLITITYANILAVKGYTDKAVKLLRTIKEDDKLFVTANIFISEIIYQQGNISKALSVLKKTYNMKKSPDLLLITADFYISEKKFNDGIKILEKGRKEYPNNDKILYKTGIIYENIKKSKLAMEYMQKTLKVNPDNPDALNFIGYSYADSGKNLEKAKKMITKALVFRPNDPYILDSMGWVYYKTKEYKQALKYLKRAIETLKNIIEPEIYEHMGDILKEMGKKKEAIKYFVISKENYKDSESIKRVGKKLIKLGY